MSNAEVSNVAIAPNAKRLLMAGFLAILAAGVGFGIRGGILANWGADFGFTGQQLGDINGAGFTGFCFGIIIGGIICDKIGYGMSRRLRTPESRTCYHFPGPDPAIPVASPTGINGPITTDKSNPPSGTIYLAPWWKMTQIKKASSRILFGDSRNTFLDPPAAGWDLNFAVNDATSGDPARHSGKRDVRAKTDPAYKTIRANYVFCDGHAESLDPEAALHAINSPQ